MKDDAIISHVEHIFMDWRCGDIAPGQFLEDLRSALRAEVDAQDVALGALADIAFSDDMTLEVARKKAARVYKELGGDMNRERK